MMVNAIAMPYLVQLLYKLADIVMNMRLRAHLIGIRLV